MPDIFVSYRRSDSQDATDRIYDRLVEAWPNDTVFRDVDSIPLSASFPSYLEEAIEACKVVLVVIGPNWLDVRDAGGNRRLDDSNDSVRREIGLALQFEKEVVPITVSHATMPTAEGLPDDIVDVLSRNGQAVRPDPDFHHDADRLIRKLSQFIDRKPVASPGKGLRRPFPTKRFVWFTFVSAWVGWFVGQRPEWVRWLFWKGGFLSDIAYAIPGALDGGLVGGVVWSVTCVLGSVFSFTFGWFVDWRRS